MLTITQLTNKAIAVTGLPEGFANPFIHDKEDIPTMLMFNDNSAAKIGFIALPPGNWSILGFSLDLKEEDWKQVVDKPLERNTPDGIQYGYMISPMDTEIYSSATECACMLLKSKDLDPLLNHLILINDEKDRN